MSYGRDFVMNALANRRRIRKCLIVVDDFTRDARISS
jgi:hypothetical protein